MLAVRESAIKSNASSEKSSLFIDVIIGSFVLPIMLTGFLSGCDTSTKQESTQDSQQQVASIDETENPVYPASEANTQLINTIDNAVKTPQPKPTQDKPIKIDWAQVDSKVQPIDAATFDYPFTLNSEPVRSYAKFFKVSAIDAQYNLSVGTASNEPLSRLLDQLGDSYLSHELINGKDIKLVVHTTPNVVASRYDYVIADDFARGLILPIEIRPTTDSNDSLSPH